MPTPMVATETIRREVPVLAAELPNSPTQLLLFSGLSRTGKFDFTRVVA